MLNRWLVFILVGMLPACLLDCDSASAPVDDSGLDAGSDTAPGNDTSGDGGSDVSNPNNRNDATIDFEDCFEQPTDAVVVNESDPFASNNRCDCSCTLREAIGRVDPGGTITLDVDVSVVSLLVFPRNISLLGQDHVITAADQFNAPGILLWFEAASATVRDLTIVASQNVAIRVDGDDSLVQNVQIDDASIGILASGTGVILSGLDLGAAHSPTRPSTARDFTAW